MKQNCNGGVFICHGRNSVNLHRRLQKEFAINPSVGKRTRIQSRVSVTKYCIRRRLTTYFPTNRARLSSTALEVLRINAKGTVAKCATFA